VLRRLVASLLGVAAIRAAFDEEHLYLQASWDTQQPRPGLSHDTFQWRDGAWSRVTTNKIETRSAPGDLGENMSASQYEKSAGSLLMGLRCTAVRI
jgi:hypothetical protein